MTLSSGPRTPPLLLIHACHFWIHLLQIAVHGSHRQALHAVEPPSIPLGTPEHSTLLLNVFTLGSIELAQWTEEDGLTVLFFAVIQVITHQVQAIPLINQ